MSNISSMVPAVTAHICYRENCDRPSDWQVWYMEKTLTSLAYWNRGVCQKHVYKVIDKKEEGTFRLIALQPIERDEYD